MGLTKYHLKVLGAFLPHRIGNREILSLNFSIARVGVRFCPHNFKQEVTCSKGGQMNQDKILREPEVLDIISCSSPTLRRLEKKGLFPSRRKIGSRAVGWLQSEVMAWVSKRVHEGSANEGDKNEY